MKPELLLVEAMMPELEAKLDTAYTVHRLASAADRIGFLAQVAPGVRAVVTGGGIGADSAIVTALPKLEVIAVNGVGADAVDLRYAKAKGIRVSNTPHSLTEDVASHGVR